jgi:hypothetical protein
MFPPKCVEVFVVSQGCSGLREKRFNRSPTLQAEKSIRLFLWTEFRHPFSPGPPHCCVPSMPEGAGKREWPSEPSWGQLGDNLPEDAIVEREMSAQGSVVPWCYPKVLPMTKGSFPRGERLLRFFPAKKVRSSHFFRLKLMYSFPCHRSRDGECVCRVSQRARIKDHVSI